MKLDQCPLKVPGKRKKNANSGARVLTSQECLQMLEK